MKLILFFLISLFLIVPVSAADWWDGYDYCKKITINQTMVNQSIGDDIFPMYVNITDSNLASKAQADGDDIVFLNAANDTQLDHQIVGTFNSTTGHLRAYINITDISNVSSINMYYGNAGATNAENPNGVWGVNASGIWLMDESIGLYVNDSSSNDNNGTLENGVMWVDDGLEYDGVDDHVNIVDSNSLDFHNGDSISLFGQVVRTATSGLYWDPILSKGGEVANPDRRNYEIAFSDSDKFVFAFRDSTDTDWHIYESTPTYTTLNESFDVVATFTFGVANSTNLYVNGEHVSGSWIYGDGSANPYVSDYPLYFGSSIRATEYFQGFTYLLSIYNRILSSEIIATRHNNSEYPELFISVGEEVSYEAPLLGTFLYPNSTYSVGCYGKLISELVYETGFNMSDIGSCNALTTGDMETLSVDDTNYIPSIDKDAAHDGYMYGNFSLHDVETVNFITVKTVHNRVHTNPVILGLFNASTQKWHAVNNSSVENVDVELTYDITGVDILKYTTLEDNVLNLSVSLNTNGDGNYDVFVDFVEVYIDYEESPDITLEYVYNLTISNQNNISILQNDVDDLENNMNNLYLFVMLCTVFLFEFGIRRRSE